MERITTWLYGIPIDAVLIGTFVCTTGLIVGRWCVRRAAGKPSALDRWRST
jgi:hypothetical protein